MVSFKLSFMVHYHDRIPSEGIPRLLPRRPHSAEPLIKSIPGLLPQELRVFLASLRSTGCQARVVIFSAGDPGDDLAALAHTFEAELLQYNYTDLSTTHGPMNMHRFELYRRFLAARGRGDYAQVLLCDVRDVFFQEDPFATLSVQAGIAVAIEPTRLLIGQCGIHAGWLSTGCPAYQAEGTLERVAGERRSCAGTTIGRHGGVLSYIEAMQREAERTVTRVTHASAAAWEGQSTTKDGEAWRLWCNDQGMHNALLWTGQFGVPGGSTVALLDPEASGLATVGTMENIYINQVGQICAAPAFPRRER